MSHTVDTVIWAGDDGWRYHPKHVEQFTDIHKLYIVASCWTVVDTYYTTHGPLNNLSTELQRVRRPKVKKGCFRSVTVPLHPLGRKLYRFQSRSQCNDKSKNCFYFLEFGCYISYSTRAHRLSCIHSIFSFSNLYKKLPDLMESGVTIFTNWNRCLLQNETPPPIFRVKLF
jgi:hypothetical protein